MSGPPSSLPIGLALTRTAKAAGRAFDERLAAAGGTLPVWLVLLALKMSPGANQRQIAETVDIQGATLTHHLNAMEKDGLVTRRRDPANRRVHVVELTPSGEELFLALREAAFAQDTALRSGFTAADLTTLAELLGRMHANALVRTQE